MTRILHIVTDSEDRWVLDMITTQAMQSTVEIKLFPLDNAEPDYHALVQEIFSADSIQVW